MIDLRLIHDAAFAGATALTELLKPGSDDEREFHRQAYEIIKATIEGYEIQKGREDKKQGPSRS